MAAKVLDGRYKLIKTLGAGGFGRTYIARDMRRPGTPPCVVKHLKPASDDPGFIREARRLFNTEAETLEKLGNHDQIPQLLAYFEEDGQFFLVQEYIEGQSLYDELKISKDEPEDSLRAEHTGTEVQVTKRDRQLSESEVVALLKDVLGILEFVHSENVIHRDIKPDNLIRRKKDGKLVLIDFGAVKAMQEPGAQVETNNGESRFTVTIGTPGFMPSEQCAGRPTFSSDIYALGMVAIKALTGYAPTDLPTDPDTGEVVWRNQTKVSTGLCMVLTRMVRYQYIQRYQSAKETLQGLAAFSITEEPTPKKTAAAIVKSSGSTATTRTVAKSQTKADSGSGLLVIGLLVIAAIASFTLFRTVQKPVVVVNSSPAPTFNPASSPDTPTPVASPPTSTPSPIASPSNNASPAKETIIQESLGLEVGKEASKEGKVKSTETASYTFTVKEGQKIKADLAGDNVVMSVLNPSKDMVGTNSPGASWESAATTSGEYQIQIKPAQGKPEGSFKLKVGLTDNAPVRNVEIKLNPPQKN